MSTLRLVKGELDKIFVRPAIFVMTAFFVLAMVLSVLAFNPAPKQDNRINFEAESVSQVYSAFYSQVDANRFKQTFDNNLEKSASKILSFYTSPTSDFYTKQMVTEQTQAVKESYNAYRELALNSITEQIETRRNTLNSEVNKLKIILANMNKIYPTLLLTKKNYNSLINNTSYLSQTISSTGDINSIDYHKEIVNKIEDNKWMSKIDDSIANIKDVTINAKTLAELNNVMVTAKTEKLPNIILELDKFNSDITTQGDSANTNVNNIQTAKDIVSKYKLVVNEVIDIVYCTLLIDICKKIPADSVSSYYGEAFKSYEHYKYVEQISKSTYLFENNVYEFEFANVYQAGFNSTYETNAYDFMYYSMELLSILIILFCVILGADMIAGEQSNGTLKLLAIRPFKRSKILKSKITSTILFGFIFVLIGMISSFIIGYYTYGIDNTPILATFNGDLTFVVEPILMMLIYLGALLIRIAFYTLIAVFLSTLFKSNIAAITISFILYLLVSLFSPVLKGTFIYKYLPFVNADLFKYFGGEFQNNGINANIFGLDFTPPIVADMNFYFSLINIAIFGILILIITHAVFKKRDIS